MTPYEAIWNLVCFIWTQLVVEHLVEMLAASRRIWSKRAMKRNEKYVDLAKSFTELHPSVFLGCPGFFLIRIRDWFYCHPISRKVNDRPDSKRVAMAEAERLDFQTFRKVFKKTWQQFPMQCMQCFLSFCIIPTFRWVSSLGGSFYGRYLRSSPDEKVAIGSSHRLNALRPFETDSVNPSTVSSGFFENHTLHIIYEYDPDYACLLSKLLGKSHTVERHARCWGSFGWPMGQQSGLSGRSKLWSPDGT